MKNVSRVLASAALAATFSLAAYAQTPAASPATTAAAPSAQEVQAKADKYKEFLDNRSKKLPNGQPDPAAQKVAYEAGKEYLSKYGSDTNEGNDKIVAYIQKWVTNYEKAVSDFQTSSAFSDAVTAKNYPKIFELGRPLLDKDPNNFSVLLTLAQAGFLNAQQKTPDKTLFPDAVRYTKNEIQAVESGKVTSFAPFKNKDELLNYLYFGLGLNLRDSSSDEAQTYFLKAAQTEGLYKSSPGTYSYLSNLYFKEYKKLADNYNRDFNGKEKTPESEAAYERLNQVLDRTIDAYARTVALTTQTDPQSVAFKKLTMTDLTALYKVRHNGTDTGLTELISGVLAKPVPNPSEEVIPTPTPLSTPTPATGAPPATDGTMTPPKPATPSTPPATVKPTPKPGAVPPSTTQKPVSKNTGAGSQSSVKTGRQ